MISDDRLPVTQGRSVAKYPVLHGLVQAPLPGDTVVFCVRGSRGFQQGSKRRKGFQQGFEKGKV